MSNFPQSPSTHNSEHRFMYQMHQHGAFGAAHQATGERRIALHWSCISFDAPLTLLRERVRHGG